MKVRLCAPLVVAFVLRVICVGESIDLIVVMISGVDDPELGKAAVEHGAYGYFVKPVGATEVYLAAVNALRRRSLEMEYRSNLERLEAMVAERSDQMARAAALQAGMLPPSPLKGQKFEVAAHFTPAREISGDFYDWHQPNPRFIAVTLGDVMGKGLPAAIMMAGSRPIATAHSRGWPAASAVSWKRRRSRHSLMLQPRRRGPSTSSRPRSWRPLSRSTTHM